MSQPAPHLAPAAGAPWHLLLGRRAPERMQAIREQVESHAAGAGRSLHWHVPERGEQTPQTALAAARAARADGGIVVAVGGDGTINAATQACLEVEVPMAVLCQGTFNFFCRQQGLPQALDEALTQLDDSLRTGSLRPVRVGDVNGQVFLVNASLGLYPHLLRDREQATRRLGRHQWVALGAGVLTLLRWRGSQLLRLRERDAHGQERQRMTLASTLFISNNALQLQAVGLEPAEAAGQGALVASTLAPRGVWSTLKLLWQAWRQQLSEHEAVDSFACTALSVEPARWRPSRLVRVAFDGERRAMALPLRFGVRPQPLWLVAPPQPAQQPADRQPAPAAPVENALAFARAPLVVARRRSCIQVAGA